MKEISSLIKLWSMVSERRSCKKVLKFDFSFRLQIQRGTRKTFFSKILNHQISFRLLFSISLISLLSGLLLKKTRLSNHYRRGIKFCCHMKVAKLSHFWFSLVHLMIAAACRMIGANKKYRSWGGGGHVNQIRVETKPGLLWKPKYPPSAAVAPLHCEELLSRDQSEKRSLGFPSEGFLLDWSSWLIFGGKLG